MRGCPAGRFPQPLRRHRFDQRHAVHRLADAAAAEVATTEDAETQTADFQIKKDAKGRFSGCPGLPFYAVRLYLTRSKAAL